MSNALTRFMETANLPALDAAAMADAIETDTGGGSVSANFLNFSGKTGRYSMGKDRVEVDPASKFVVDPAFNRRGWICWKNSKVAKRHDWSIYSHGAAIAAENLEDLGPYKPGDGWSEERAFACREMDGGAQVIFSTSSKSGNNSVVQLWNEVAARLKLGEPAYPVIAFTSEKFVAQDQTNYKPVFTVLGWTNATASQAFFNGDISAEEMMGAAAPKQVEDKKGKK
jgi:hypothetical protein